MIMATIRMDLLPSDVPETERADDLDPTVFAGVRSGGSGHDYACGNCGEVLVFDYDYATAPLKISDAVIVCPKCGARNRMSPEKS
ncbi:hypothetical protein [Salinarimonas rosea]|uniref:hypothetical protein n=1 Tax=Salinarimonas rosea TaxID=552063 RepID=UPI0003FCE0F4|nr:hypothetical protein [Salinarimonas rosea]